MYCPDCRRMLPEEFCPRCLRPTRAPLPEDECLLTETAALWRSVLMDVLTQAGIPCRTVPASGAAAALRMGPLAEGYRFYVPVARLEEARQLAEDLFAPADPPEGEA